MTEGEAPLRLYDYLESGNGYKVRLLLHLGEDQTLHQLLVPVAVLE